MCNLSEYVEPKGIIKGEIKGKENLIKLFTWLQEIG